MQSALIVIPTYNEKGNIARMLEAIFELKHPVYKISVLVVDDKSPDGTGEIVKKLQKTNKNIHLIEGDKAGLGKAYQRGFIYAEENIDFDVIMQMDADFSHPPTDIIHLLNAIHKGADVAIGSRYTPGGMIPGNWPLMRILNSKVANFVARFVGGIQSDAKELTGGFKAIRKSALNKIPYRSARTSGYGIMIFLSNQFAVQKLKIVEVPICFRDREVGESKIRTKDIIEFFKIAYSLNETSPFKDLIGLSLFVIITSLVEIGMFLGLINYTTYAPVTSAVITIISSAAILFGSLEVLSLRNQRPSAWYGIIKGQKPIRRLFLFSGLKVAIFALTVIISFKFLPIMTAITLSIISLIIVQLSLARRAFNASDAESQEGAL